jgi:hypothetical protein
MRYETLVVDLYKPAVQMMVDRGDAWFSGAVSVSGDSDPNSVYKVIRALRYFICIDIDEKLKHPMKLLRYISISDIDDILTNQGLEAFKNNGYESYIVDELAFIEEFISQDEWNVYEGKLIFHTFILEKKDDWRVLEYERLTAVDEE